MGARGRFGDASGGARDGFWTPKCCPKAYLGAPPTNQKRPRAVQKRRQGTPETFQKPPEKLPRRLQRRSRRQTQSEAQADRFLIDFRSMRRSSEVRFVLVFTVFFRCRTFCVLIASRVAKSRKNHRLGLENWTRGGPGEAWRSKLERKNGQVERKSASKVPPGSPKMYKSARTRQLRARKRGQCPRRAGGPPRTPRGNFGTFVWIGV